LSQPNVDTVRGVYDALGRGDMDAALAGLDPEIVWIEPDTVPWGGTRHGHDGFLEVVEAIGASTDEPAFGDDTVFAGDGEHVIVFGTFSGTVKATGEQVSWDFADVWTLRDGKAVRFKAYLDTLVTQRAYA
jgi:ketosteroid isomerase-like protein